MYLDSPSRYQAKGHPQESQRDQSTSNPRITVNAEGSSQLYLGPTLSDHSSAPSKVNYISGPIYYRPGCAGSNQPFSNQQLYHQQHYVQSHEANINRWGHYTQIQSLNGNVPSFANNTTQPYTYNLYLPAVNQTTGQRCINVSFQYNPYLNRTEDHCYPPILYHAGVPPPSLPHKLRPAVQQIKPETYSGASAKLSDTSVKATASADEKLKPSKLKIDDGSSINDMDISKQNSSSVVKSKTNEVKKAVAIMVLRNLHDTG